MLFPGRKTLVVGEHLGRKRSVVDDALRSVSFKKSKLYRNRQAAIGARDPTQIAASTVARAALAVPLTKKQLKS